MGEIKHCASPPVVLGVGVTRRTRRRRNEEVSTSAKSTSHAKHHPINTYKSPRSLKKIKAGRTCQVDWVGNGKCSNANTPVP